MSKPENCFLVYGGSTLLHINSMGKTYQLTIESRAENLAAVSDFINHAARACGLDEDASCDAQMAVDEACANVMEHAYAGRDDGRIEIACERRGKEFVVIIQDDGARFDPKKVAKPKTHAPLSKRDIGGLGIFFMYKLMDKVKFDFRAGHNVLTMAKKIK